MKKRLGTLIILVLAIAMLFFPAAKLVVLPSIEADIASQFPATISLGDVLLKGSAALPLVAVPQLQLAQLGNVSLLIGTILLVLAVGASLVKKRGSLQATIALAVASCGFSGAFALQCNNAASSLLFGYLLDVQAWVYFPAVLGAILAGYCVLLLRGEIKA